MRKRKKWTEAWKESCWNGGRGWEGCYIKSFMHGYKARTQDSSMHGHGLVDITKKWDEKNKKSNFMRGEEVKRENENAPKLLEGKLNVHISSIRSQDVKPFFSASHFHCSEAFADSFNFSLLSTRSLSPRTLPTLPMLLAWAHGNF